MLKSMKTLAVTLTAVRVRWVSFAISIPLCRQSENAMSTPPRDLTFNVMLRKHIGTPSTPLNVQA
jgi:hypothetical protein